MPEHVFDHTAKRRLITANAPSVLIAQVTDKLRSAPVTLLDQGDGATPLGSRHPAPGSYEPQKIVGALPGSKWAAQAGVGAGGVRGPQKVRRTWPALTPAQPRVHRTVARHPTGRAPSNLFVARGQGRFGHRHSSVASVGRRRCPIRSGGWWPTPCPGSPATPYCKSRIRRRRRSRTARSSLG